MADRLLERLGHLYPRGLLSGQQQQPWAQSPDRLRLGGGEGARLQTVDQADQLPQAGAGLNPGKSGEKNGAFKSERTLRTFFTGNPVSDPDEYPDQTVCFGDSCYPQSAVNYVAQGMYAAASGQSLEQSEWIVNEWKEINYDEYASPEVLYWHKYGYDYYNRREEDEKTRSE